MRAGPLGLARGGLAVCPGAWRVWNGARPIYGQEVLLVTRFDLGLPRPISSRRTLVAGLARATGELASPQVTAVCQQLAAGLGRSAGTMADCPDLTYEPLLPSVSSCPERAGSPAGRPARGARSLPQTDGDLMSYIRHRVAVARVCWFYS